MYIQCTGESFEVSLCGNISVRKCISPVTMYDRADCQMRQKALSGLQLALLFGVFSRQQFIQLITAYMTEILTLHVVEDKLTNILAAVANTFDRTRTENHQKVPPWAFAPSFVTSGQMLQCIFVNWPECNVPTPGCE